MLGAVSAAVALDAASALFVPRLRAWLQIVGAMTFCNPFSPELAAHEKEALPPDELVDTGGASSLPGAVMAERPNAVRLRQRLRPVLDVARARLASGLVPSREDRRLYEDACLHFLLGQHGAALQPFIDPKPVPPATGGEPEPRRGGRRPRPGKAAPATSPSQGLPAADRAAQGAAYAAFLQDYQDYLVRPSAALAPMPPERLFGRCFQIRRALHYIGAYLVGTSPAMVRLRTRLWEAIFTTDMCDYLHGEDDGLDDMHTIILGESGTGKELVAQAIGRTGFVPFLVDQRCFAAADGEHYHCLSLVERAATLIQAELFGYEAGAFTGADRDTPGWLELCPSGGRLFLDEIAELDVSLQPMLLRVIQSRTFQRLGSRTRRGFSGRLISATNRNLRTLIGAEKFRDELYQRLAVDEIRTPAVREQLAGAPDDLHLLVLHIAVKIRGPEQGPRLAAKAMEIMAAKPGPGYLWPGNVREIERRVRRIFLHDNDVHAIPSTKRPAPASETAATLGRDILEGRMTMEEIERRVVQAVYQKTKSRRQGARMLDITRDRFAKRLREALGEETPGT
jgi:transcriptional regulator with AAA-type ATPase domain